MRVSSLVVFAVLTALTSCAADSDGANEGEGEGEPVTGAALCLDVDEHDYGTVIVGESSAPATFVLTNCGNAESGFVAVQAEGNFVVNAFDCGRLAVNATCSVSVTFAPNASGPHEGSVTLTDDGDVVGDEVLVAVITLSGNGANGAAFSFAPSSLDFGSVIVGASTSRALSITNDGDTAGDTLGVIGGINSDAYSVVGTTCSASLSPGGACNVEIAFAPLSAGAKSGTFTVGETVAPLSGIALADAQLVVAPTSFNFGAVGLGVSSAEQDFIVTNLGDVDSGPLNELVDGADVAEFVITGSGCDGQVLGPNQSCVVSITFSPVGAPGARAAALRVASDPGGEVNAALSATAIPGESITCNPAALDFGDVVVGFSSDEQTCTITNDGGLSTGVLTTSLGGVDAAEFVTSDDSCDGTSLAPGESCTVTMFFAPTSQGAASATMTVATENGGVAIVALSGEGIVGPLLDASPSGVDFGTQANGFASAPIDIVVTNSGDRPTSIVPVVTLGGTNVSQFDLVSSTCVTALDPGGDCIVTVRYTPTSASTHNATITIDFGEVNALLVPLTGTSAPFDALFFAGQSGNAFDFGDVAVGDQSATQRTVTLINFADIDIEISTLTLVGANATSFTIVSEDCDVLSPGETCDINIAFAPQSPPGSKVAQFRADSVPSSGEITTGNLTGNALP